VFIPIFRKNWTRIIKKQTIVNILQNESSQLTEILKILYKIKAKQKTIKTDPINPSCSEIVAKKK